MIKNTLLTLFILLFDYIIAQTMETMWKEWEPEQKWLGYERAGPDSVWQPKKDFYPTEIRRKVSLKQWWLSVYSGQEKPNTGIYNEKFDKKGVYNCVVCSETLFSSSDKVAIKNGWPTFVEPIGEVHKTHDWFIWDYDLRQFGEIWDEYRPKGKNRNTYFKCENCGSFIGRMSKKPEKNGQKYYVANSSALQFKGDDPDDVSGMVDYLGVMRQIPSDN